MLSIAFKMQIIVKFVVKVNLIQSIMFTHKEHTFNITYIERMKHGQFKAIIIIYFEKFYTQD